MPAMAARSNRPDSPQRNRDMFRRLHPLATNLLALSPYPLHRGIYSWGHC